jgi:hypothetical protein
MKKLITLGIALAMLATMILPVAAMAAPGAGDLDTLVTGNLGSYYTVDAPDNFGMVITSAAGGNSGSKAISFATNDNGMTSVKVEVLADNNGFLTSSVPTSLSTALSVSGSGLTTRTLTDTNQSLVDALSLALVGVEKTASVSDMVITQPAFNAVASGAYTATITFTVTFN